MLKEQTDNTRRDRPHNDQRELPPSAIWVHIRREATRDDRSHATAQQRNPVAPEEGQQRHRRAQMEHNEQRKKGRALQCIIPLQNSRYNDHMSQAAHREELRHSLQDRHHEHLDGIHVSPVLVAPRYCGASFDHAYSGGLIVTHPFSAVNAHNIGLTYLATCAGATYQNGRATARHVIRILFLSGPLSSLIEKQPLRTLRRSA